MLVTGPVDPPSANSRAYAIQLLRRRTALGMDNAVRFMLAEAAEDGQHPVHDEDVAALYRVSDALLITTASEGFGLPLLEAALARVPIVCTDLHGWPVDLASDEQDPFKLNRDRPEVSAFESVRP